MVNLHGFRTGEVSLRGLHHLKERLAGMFIEVGVEAEVGDVRWFVPGAGQG